MSLCPVTASDRRHSFVQLCIITPETGKRRQHQTLAIIKYIQLYFSIITNCALCGGNIMEAAYCVIKAPSSLDCHPGVATMGSDY